MGKQNKNNISPLRLHKAHDGEPVSLVVDGERVEACRGENLHAALLAAGKRNLRNSATGQQRGVFCGMGICYECLVTVNGRPNQRACMTPVSEGLEIVTCEE